MKVYYPLVLYFFLAGAVIYSLVDRNNVEEQILENQEKIELIEQVIIKERVAQDKNELNCLAQNIYWESRNQPENGRLAVAQVTLNRVDDPRFPDTICGVVKQTKYYPSGRIDLHSCQFSWYCDGKSDVPFGNEQRAWNDALALATSVLFERPEDNTGGALWYHNTKVEPNWSKTFYKVVKIKDHIFYTDMTKT